MISNPIAGRGSRGHLDRALTRLRTSGVRVDLWQTRRKGDALALARTAAGNGADLVIAAGGDGTINEVVNGLAYTGVPLGVLPLGTANVFARELSLPRDPEGAAAVILREATRTVHLGRAADRLFLVMAGVGFDAQVVYELDLGLKALAGKLAYLATGLKVLFAPPRRPLRISIDGEEVAGYGAIVGKGRHYGGGFRATPLADLERRELDVCVFQKSSPWSILRYAAGIARGNHLALPDVHYRKGVRVRISSTHPLHVQADGDLIGTLPMEFTVAEDAIEVLSAPGAG